MMRSCVSVIRWSRLLGVYWLLLSVLLQSEWSAVVSAQSSSGSSGSGTPAVEKEALSSASSSSSDDEQGPEAEGGFWIPGATQTEKGYDTEFGTQAICWKSFRGNSSNTEDLTSLSVKNVVKSFGIDNNDAIRMLTKCPTGNALTATSPVEAQRGERLRTGTWYNYSAHVTLDLTSLDGLAFVSDELEPEQEEDGVSSSAAANNIMMSNLLNLTTTRDRNNQPLRFTVQKVAVQLIVCKLGAGFCSPFVHEIANKKLAAQGLPLSPARGDLHGGTHVHSPASIVTLDRALGPKYEFDVTIPMLVNNPNALFGVAVAQMFVTLHNSTNHTSADLRFDMANALTGQQRLLNYQAPPDILTVPRQLEILAYTVIGLSSAVIAFLLLQTIRYRHHQILTLTQGHFLIVMLSAALVASVSTFLLEPVSDIYCRFGLPIVLMSLQLLYAVTVGRLWRINAVISPLLVQTMNKTGQTRSQAVMWWIRTRLLTLGTCGCLDQNGHGDQDVQRAIRKQFTQRQLAIVIAVVTAPQVVIQVLGMILQPLQLEIQFNADESIGRPVCSTGVADNAHELVNYGIGLLLVLLIALLCMAHATRSLPSLFNETQLIFDSTLSSLILGMLGGTIILVTNSPTTNPAVGYMVWVAVVLSLTLQASLRIMLPKLRMAWKNETVLVSTLVSDHARNMRLKGSTTSNDGKDRVQITGLSFPGRDSLYRASELEPLAGASSSGVESGEGSSYYDDTTEDYRDGVDSQSPVVYSNRKLHSNIDGDDLGHRGGTASVYTHSTVEITEGHNGSNPMTPSDTEGGLSHIDVDEVPIHSMEEGGIRSSSGHSDNVRSKSAPKLLSRQHSREGKKGKRKLSYVSTDKTPSKRLLLKMLDLQSRLSHVNERVMTGLSVSEDEWTDLRAAMRKLGHTFEYDVKFEWEQHGNDATMPTSRDYESVVSRRTRREFAKTVSFAEDITREPLGAASGSPEVAPDGDGSSPLKQQQHPTSSNNEQGNTTTTRTTATISDGSLLTGAVSTNTDTEAANNNTQPVDNPVFEDEVDADIDVSTKSTEVWA